MIKIKTMKNNMKIFALLLLSIILSINIGKAQVPSNDSAGRSDVHPYRVNYWVAGGIIASSMVGDYFAIPRIKNKGNIADSDFRALDRSHFTSFDRYALNLDASKRQMFAKVSDYTLSGIIILPVLLTLNKHMRKDWKELLTIYVESQSITFDFYNYSFLGPSFQDKYRPAVYYSSIPNSEKAGGYYKSSFYSGHMATTTAATFFMVKAYSDYHPDMNLGSKFLWYGIASIPPFIEGYMRVHALAHFPSDVMVGYGLGALCGIVIPELHKRGHKNTTLGVFSSPYGTGLSMSGKF
jgi:membrane-associated phospholipid phosphatase